MACRKEGLEPGRRFDLSSIRSIGAAGSPLPVEGFDWLYDQLGPEVFINLGSGGTDICTGIVQGYPLLPVYAGEMSGRCLGVDVQSFSPDGKPVVGELGELVIAQPMPSMPVGLWNDPDGSRMRAAYFDHFPGVWRHGDWILFTERGSSVITGRSDATLNRGGVRLGTSEFYVVVEEIDEVLDSLVVHLDEGDELLLFVALRDGVELDDELRARIATVLRTALSPRHAPDAIVAVPSIPRTLTGKKLELPVKNILTGAEAEDVASKDALVDPSSLDAFVDYARVQSLMPLERLHHVLVLTDDLETTKAFYEALGLEVGERPPLEFPGYWLYLDGVPCLHVADRAAYEAHASTLGLRSATRVDHLAFAGVDYEQLAARLEAAGVDAVPNAAPGIRQLFLTDPNGVRVEINVPD